MSGNGKPPSGSGQELPPKNWGKKPSLGKTERPHSKFCVVVVECCCFLINIIVELREHGVLILPPVFKGFFQKLVFGLRETIRSRSRVFVVVGRF